jgi:DNA modification methylase
MFFNHEIIDIESIIPFAMNSRLHSDAQVAQLAASIREFGFTNPVLIDEAKNLIAGHGRVMAARKLGLPSVPAIVVTGLDERKRRALVIADNKLAMNATWDDEVLKNELSDLAADFGELMGFSEDELAAMLQEATQIEDGLTDEDAVPELAAEPVTKPGDVWLLGKHRLMCGDSTSIDAVDTLMDGGKADMVFTDPPYGMFLETGMSARVMPKGDWKNKPKKYENVIGDHEDFSPSLISSIFASFPDTKEIFIWGADYFAELLPEKNEGSWLVWDKRQGLEDVQWSTSEFELCWSKVKHQRKIARIRWMGLAGTEKEFDKKRHHPTQKPVDLVVWFFDQWGKDCTIVADLFGGSGSTLLACEKTKKQARLMELDPKYCDVIVKRWQDFTGKKATHAETGKTFAEYADGKA